MVQALNVVDAKQRAILEENYGQHDMQKVEKVKQLYQDIDMTRIFEQYEEESYARLQGLLFQVTDMPRDVFDFLLKKIYKRSK